MLTILFILLCFCIWWAMVKQGCRDIKKQAEAYNDSDWAKARRQRSNLKWQKKHNTEWWQKQQKR